MKKIIVIFCLIIVLITNTIYAQDLKYIHAEYDFKPKEEVYLFGDNVKLRAEPNTESEVIDVLKIGAKINILEKTEKILTYEGYNSPWYKVRYKNKIGFLIKGLIALDKKERIYSSKSIKCSK